MEIAKRSSEYTKVNDVDVHRELARGYNCEAVQISFSKYIVHRNWLCNKNRVFFFFFFSFIFISWRLITLQYCSGFCHTLT